MDRRLLKRSYTSEEMDRGDGMKFHPVRGAELRTLHFISHRSRYFGIIFSEERWFYPGLSLEGAEEMIGVVFILGRIGDEKPHQAGEGYLPHWVFDPWTGEHLGSMQQRTLVES